MELRQLTSAPEIIDELGGPTAVAKLTNRKAPQVVSNWRAANSFPSNTFLAITMALRERNVSAPPTLWGMSEPERVAS